MKKTALFKTYLAPIKKGLDTHAITSVITTRTCYQFDKVVYIPQFS